MVQDCSLRRWPSGPAYVLPGAAYAERDGSYVNRGDRLQSARLGHPPADGRADGREPVCGNCPGRRGLYNFQAVLEEIAREILYFSAIVGPVPETGIDLRSNLLAGETRKSANSLS